LCASHQIAEILRYAWHLMYQNIQSVLRDDPSLAVVLPEDHTCEVVEAPAVEAVAEDYYEPSEAPARKSKQRSRDREEDTDYDQSEEIQEQLRHHSEPRRTSSGSARTERSKTARPAPTVAHRENAPARQQPPVEQPIYQAYSSLATASAAHELPAVKAEGASVSPEAYFQLHRAVECRPWMVAGRIVINGVLDANSKPMKLSDLPAVPADSQLRWALCILRDQPVQALLRKQFATRLKDLINSSADTSALTSLENAHAAQFAAKVQLPALDGPCRMLFQMCQLSVTYEHRIDPFDEFVLRVHIPLLVYHVLQHIATENGATPSSTGGSSQGAMSKNNSQTSLNATAHSKNLAAAAKEVLRSVFEHQPLPTLAARTEVTTCFSDPKALRDFLEGIAMHLINMKQLFFKKPAQ
jgi:hypothetical protein